MKQLFASQDPVVIEIARNSLQAAGIECQLLHEMVSSAFAASPWGAEMFELWIIDDQDESKARAIIERLQSRAARETQPRQSWECPQCKQMIEGQFTDCWYCLLEEEYDPR